MADPGFPSQYTTTTTTTSTAVVTNIRFDPSYVRTIPGILKIVAMVLDILGFICIMVSANSQHSRAGWFNFCAMGGFWTTGILLVMYLFHAIEKLHFIPWLLVEFAYCAAWSFFYMTASSACAAWGSHDEAWAAAAFFGYLAMLVYGADAYFKFKGWRSGEIAQGERHVQKTTSTVTSPVAY